MNRLPLDEFIDRLSRIMPLIARHFIRHQTKDILQQELTFSQYLVLNLLEHEGKMRMKDLAEKMGVTNANMTGIIDRLIRQEYLQRSSDPHDRRVIYVDLSQKGRAFLKRIEDARRKAMIKVFKKLSDYDRQEYLRILTQISQILLEK